MAANKCVLQNLDNGESRTKTTVRDMEKDEDLSKIYGGTKV